MALIEGLAFHPLFMVLGCVTYFFPYSLATNLGGCLDTDSGRLEPNDREPVDALRIDTMSAFSNFSLTPFPSSLHDVWDGRVVYQTPSLFPLNIKPRLRCHVKKIVQLVG